MVKMTTFKRQKKKMREAALLNWVIIGVIFVLMPLLFLVACIVIIDFMASPLWREVNVLILSYKTDFIDHDYSMNRFKRREVLARHFS
jgi:hypothetical protein